MNTIISITKFIFQEERADRASSEEITTLEGIIHGNCLVEVVFKKNKKKMN